jgi:hypothetical protein
VADAPAGSGLDDFFAKKYGPLPGWGWTALAAGGAGLYVWYRDKHAASTGTSTATGTSSATTGFDYAPSIAAQQSEIQALQQGQAASNTAATSSTGTTSSTTATTTAPSNYSVPAGSSQSGPVPTTAVYGGQSLGSVLASLQGAGYGVSGVSYASQPVSSQNIGQFYSTPVYSVTTTGSNVAIGLQ